MILPTVRLGSKSYRDVIEHKYFSGVSWSVAGSSDHVATHDQIEKMLKNKKEFFLKRLLRKIRKHRKQVIKLTDLKVCGSFDDYRMSRNRQNHWIVSLAKTKSWILEQTFLKSWFQDFSQQYPLFTFVSEDFGKLLSGQTSDSILEAKSHDFGWWKFPWFVPVPYWLPRRAFHLGGWVRHESTWSCLNEAAIFIKNK